MKAVIKIGGKQYNVAQNHELLVEKLIAEPGETVEIKEVLLINDGSVPRIGTPLVEGAIVTAEILEQTRAAKIIVFKKKRRQNYRRKNGHRQYLTRLKITRIVAA